MEIVNLAVADIIPYENNPRINDKAVKGVANSIKEFGFRNPIIVDAGNVIICGHTRLKAAKKLGYETVPCIVASDLTPEQVTALRLADNKVAEKAEWDEDALREELNKILEIDMSDFGFLEADLKEDTEEKYSQEIKPPIYEITGADPSLDECYDTKKCDAFLERIEAADIPEDEKEFLRARAKALAVFNFKNIAEHYAHVSKEIQELMEMLVLVQIDYEHALEYGYAQMNEAMEDIVRNEK